MTEAEHPMTAQEVTACVVRTLERVVPVVEGRALTSEELYVRIKRVLSAFNRAGENKPAPLGELDIRVLGKEHILMLLTKIVYDCPEHPHPAEETYRFMQRFEVLSDVAAGTYRRLGV